MRFKLIVAFLEDETSDRVIEAARGAGATGVSIINQVRGEGLKRNRIFMGLELDSLRDMTLFLVEEGSASAVMQAISEAGEIETRSGAGLAFQLDVEQVAGIDTQRQFLKRREGE